MQGTINVINICPKIQSYTITYRRSETLGDCWEYI